MSLPPVVQFDFHAMIMPAWVADEHGENVQMNSSLQDVLKKYAPAPATVTELFRDVLSSAVDVSDLLTRLLALAGPATVEAWRKCTDDHPVGRHASVVEVGDSLGIRLVRPEGFRYRNTAANRVHCDLTVVARRDTAGIVVAVQGQFQEADSRLSQVTNALVRLASTAILARSVSHNHGSHGLYHVAQVKEVRATMTPAKADKQYAEYLSYLRERLLLLATVARRESMHFVPTRLRRTVERLSNLGLLTEYIARDEGTEIIKFNWKSEGDGEVDLPGGVLGEQAIGLFIENTVRDIVKHRPPSRSLRTLDVSVGVSEYPTNKDFITFSLRCDVPIEDDSWKRLKTTFTTLDIVNEQLELLSSSWGMKERALCACLLRGMLQLQNLFCDDSIENELRIHGRSDRFEEPLLADEIPLLVAKRDGVVGFQEWSVNLYAPRATQVVTLDAVRGAEHPSTLRTRSMQIEVAQPWESDQMTRLRFSIPAVLLPADVRSSVAESWRAFRAPAACTRSPIDADHVQRLWLAHLLKKVNKQPSDVTVLLLLPDDIQCGNEPRDDWGSAPKLTVVTEKTLQHFVATEGSIVLFNSDHRKLTVPAAKTYPYVDGWKGSTQMQEYIRAGASANPRLLATDLAIAAIVTVVVVDERLRPSEILETRGVFVLGEEYSRANPEEWLSRQQLCDKLREKKKKTILNQIHVLSIHLGILDRMAKTPGDRMKFIHALQAVAEDVVVHTDRGVSASASELTGVYWNTFAATAKWAEEDQHKYSTMQQLRALRFMGGSFGSPR